MNKENLQKMADYIRTVPQEKFGMQMYRSTYQATPECSSVGCVIGHCTILATEPLPMMVGHEDRIDFENWSQQFTGLDFERDEWEWCFGGRWVEGDNTPEGAALRIEWLIKNGLPENWEEQAEGYEPLCYK